VIKEIVDSVLNHVGKAPPFDDMCLVVIERTADPIQPLQKTSAHVEGNDFDRSLVETASEEQLVAKDTDV
jgi:phosphoserine phosphatase RsbU/P